MLKLTKNNLALKIGLFFLFFLTFSPCFSQKSFLKDTLKLSFHLNNANFVWNNEYFNDIVKGYTLIGFFFTPTIEYRFTPHIKANGGVHLLKYSGKDKFSQIAPVYSVSYQKKDFSLLFGTLKGTINHRLSEPILLQERYFTNHLESGIQALWNKPKFFLDIWLDWRNFIVQNDSKQEVLTAGISAQAYVFKNENWELLLPISLLLEHRGGQIDTSSVAMKTAMNYSFGLQATRHLPFKYLSKIRITSQYIGFLDNSPSVNSLFKDGYGLLTKLSLYKGKSFFSIAYWEAEKYLSLLGHPMYQSFSANGKHKNNRKLFISKLYWNYLIYKGIDLGFTAETFYDVKSSDFDFTVGLTLLINYSFF